MWAGRALGDFTLGAKLGEGGFGAVYRADQRGLDRPAVVKVIRRGLASDTGVAERFALEARLASRFDHPYAAHVYAFGVEPDGVAWIAMELVRGTPLSELLARSGPLALARFVPLADKLCEAVQAAHDQGIVHRDIKPSNVMVVQRSGRLLPKLLDFGIAKLVGDVRPSIAPRKLDPAVTQPELDCTLDARSAGTLTRTGQILGSPAYMAPEQWVDASRVGPATDQYALAMLAYEALTGTRPFGGATASDLCDAHLRAPLPAHPAIPAAVHAVLARASAKSPDARFASVSALGAALRGCCTDVASEPEPALELPSELARWTTLAPRPVAIALAAVAAARSTLRGNDRACEAARVLAHWLGAIALAAASRQGPLAGAAADGVRELRRRPLRASEWLDLASALAPPIPELAPFLAGPAGAALRVLVGDAEGGDALARLDVVLSGAAWLLDYGVARESATGLEPWIGIAGDDTVDKPRAEAAPARVMLVGPDGEPVAALSPIVIVAAPTEGQREHLFVLAGPGRAPDTARYIGGAVELERAEAWSTFALADDTRSPYPGLSSFTTADADTFVGREREVGQFVARLEACSKVVLVGPSGVGKSSFLAAGVAPALPSGWSMRFVRPGRDPLSALAAVVDPGSPYRDGFATDLGRELAAMAERRGGTLVLAIDQAEELFTLCADADQRAAFAAAVVRAARSPAIRVVVALRDDFLCRVEELPPWRDELASAVQILRVPDEDVLARMVATPARRRGYELDDPALASELAAEIAGRPGALPLLAFTTAQLWERRDRHFRRLTRAAYIAIGGVTGALVQYADGVVDALPTADRRLVRLAFRRLIAPDGTRVAIGRAELVAALGGATRVVDALLASRLIVSHEDDDGEHVEIVHEALVEMWPRLAAWRREDTATLQIHHQLAAAARHWHERGRDPGLLWAGEALADLARFELHTTDAEEAFVTASRRANTSSRRRRFVAVAAAVGSLAVGVVVLAGYSRALAGERVETVRRLADGFVERARLAVADEDNPRALLYLAEARRLGASSPAADLLTAHAAAAIESERAIVARDAASFMDVRFDGPIAVAVDTELVARAWDTRTHALLATRTGVVDAVAVGARIAWLAGDGRLDVTDLDGTARWHADTGATSVYAGLDTAGDVVVAYGPGARVSSLSDGRERGVLAQGAEITSAAVDPAGALIATGDAAGGIRIWNADNTTLRATCDAHGSAVIRIAFSPDGALVAAGGAAGEVVACDTATGTTRAFTGHDNAVSSVAISPDGRRVVSSGHDGIGQIWDIATGRRIAKLIGHRGTVASARFSPSGERIATAGLDGTLRIWDVATGGASASLHAGSAIRRAEWRDDDVVVSASFDGTIREWSVGAALQARSAQVTSGPIANIAVSPDGRWAAIAGGDRLAITEIATGSTRARIDGAFASVAIAPDSRTAVTTDGSGTVTAWSVPGGVVLWRTHGTAVAYAPSGALIVAGDRALRIVGPEGNELARIALTSEVGDLVLDHAGRYAFAVAPRGAPTAADAPVVDLADGRVVAHLTLARSPSFALAIDDTRVAACDGTGVQIWELGTWRPAGTWVGHKGACKTLAFLPDGRLLSAGQDRTAIVWSTTGRVLASLVTGNIVASFAASPDGALFVTAEDDGMARIWDAATLHVLLARSGHVGIATDLAFTPEGRWLLVGGTDGRVVTADLRRPTRALAELDRLVRCRVPLQFDGEAVVPRTLDPDDPACR